MDMAEQLKNQQDHENMTAACRKLDELSTPAINDFAIIARQYGVTVDDLFESWCGC